MKNNTGIVNSAFLDIVLNFALAMIVLFIISVLMITPPNPKDGLIDSKDSFMITLDWNGDLSYDIDLYIRNPEGEIVYFRHKDAPWATLERDDLGIRNDTMIVDGNPIVYKINREVLHLRNIVPGEYTINIHVFSGSNILDEKPLPENISIEFIQLQPGYAILFKKLFDIQLPIKGEMTAFNFVYQLDKPVIIDTKTQNPFVSQLLSEVSNGAL